MNIDGVIPLLLFALFALLVGSFLIKVIKYGGFKAALFGAPIEQTVGEVSSSGAKLVKTVLKIHSLGANSTGKAVGVELIAKSFASYQTLPTTLTITEAKKLITLPESATRRR